MSDESIPENKGIPNFARRAQRGVSSAASSERFLDTREKRIQRRFSIREVCDFLGMSRSVVKEWMDAEDAPTPIFKGRENTLSLHDIMKLRALAASRKPIPGARSRKPTLFWRKPGDPLPVITFSSQKGGVAKSLTAASVAQFSSLYHGLRVGLIDSDAQATLSLYFADTSIDVAGIDTETFTKFMGVPTPGEEPLQHTDEELDAFWQKTPWPGVRLIPGGAPIQEADISMFLMSQGKDPKKRRVYRLLKDTIDRWSAAHPPKTQPEDLRDENGKFLDDKFEAALNETFDLIIIDCAPALTLTQLNSVVAATTLIVPNTLKGFDLSTLGVYLSSLDDYFTFTQSDINPIEFPPLPSYILPTNVEAGNHSDVELVGELYGNDPEVICPVYFQHSAAVANAAKDYLSIYEYDPPKSRKRSADLFKANADAVADAILTRASPNIQPRGFANAFLKEKYEGVIPPWTPEPEEASDTDRDVSDDENDSMKVEV
jgi:chromosome partitioning protein